MARSSADRERFDRFVEHVAEGATITAAGKAVGMKQQAASRAWQAVKREMGEQAK